MKKIILWVMLLVMLLGVGCAKQQAPPQETPLEQQPMTEDGYVIAKVDNGGETSDSETKETINISASLAKFGKEEFIEQSELIVLGKVLKQTRQYFTAPNGDEKLKNGENAINAQVTEYQLEITRLIKGEYDSNTILIKVYNGEQLTPQQFLTGKDENATVVSNIPTCYLEQGEEYLLGLYYFERDYLMDGESGYNIVSTNFGLFVKQENGMYKNSSHPKTFEVDIEQLTKECQKRKEK